MNIFKLIRISTKPFILAIEKLFNPSPIQRDPESQQKIDTEIKSMVIYQYHGCPFCMITRRATRRLNLGIELRDVLNNSGHKAALIHGGGKNQVPCLRIEENENITWMYESKDIISYLDNRFGDKQFEEAA